MAKKTLLEIVQDILSDMDSDEVNSIDDTVESQQVAQIVRSCFEEMVSNRNWPHTRKLIQLESLNDLDKPNYLRLPSGLKEMSLFKYDKHKEDEPLKIDMRDVTYKEPDAFLRMVSSRNNSIPNIISVTDFTGIQLLVMNDRAPQFWTSFDDTHLVCDSYDASVDDTLKQSKTQALAYIEPVWVHTNEAIPDLPTDAFSSLIEESKSTAFFTLKQMVNTKSEQKAARQKTWLSRKAWRAEGGVKYANFGRKGRR